MKISKSLLKSIALGLAISGTASCSLFEEETIDQEPTICGFECEVDHNVEKSEEVGGNPDWDCMACGFG